MSQKDLIKTTDSNKEKIRAAFTADFITVEVLKIHSGIFHAVLINDSPQKHENLTMIMRTKCLQKMDMK